MSTDLPFYFFFGVLGLVVGGLVVWFLLAEHPFEVPEELAGPVDSVETALIAHEMASRGRPMDEAAVNEVLEIHAAYLEGSFDSEHQRAERERLRAERAALLGAASAYSATESPAEVEAGGRAADTTGDADPAQDRELRARAT
jgi:hypothetical protein